MASATEPEYILTSTLITDGPCDSLGNELEYTAIRKIVMVFTTDMSQNQNTIITDDLCDSFGNRQREGPLQQLRVRTGICSEKYDNY